MAEPIDLTKLDKRTAERFILLGLLNEKEWEKHQKSLPDAGEKSAVVETMMGDEVDDDDEADEA